MSLPDWAPASASESVVWRGQPRRRVVYRGVALGLALAIPVLGVGVLLAPRGRTGVLTVATVLLLAGLVFAVPTAAAVLWRRHTHYLVTDSALYHRTGVVSITVTELGLEKVQNTAYDQGILGTLFDHGTVTVDTAGSEGPELRFSALDDPDEVHQTVAARAGAGGDADGFPGSLAAWQAVLDEVRRVRVAFESE